MDIQQKFDELIMIASEDDLHEIMSLEHYELITTYSMNVDDYGWQYLNEDDLALIERLHQNYVC